MARVSGRVPRRLVAAALALGLASLPASAQNPSTLGDFLTLVERAATKVSLATTNATVNATLDSLIRVVRASDADQLTFKELGDIAQKRAPSIVTIARWHNEPVRDWTPLVAAITGIREIVLGVIAQPTSADPDVKAAEQTSNDIGTSIRFAASANAADQLRAFEIKFGPTAPRLNGAEVILNYLGQVLLPCTNRWQWPCFGVRSDGSPSPFEIVAAYRSTTFTMTDQDSDKTLPRLVSAGQAGLRVYRFAKGWGDGGALARMMRPSNATFGVLALGHRDAPLISPVARDARFGGFAAWGDLQAGWVGGTRSRFVFGVGKQIVPYLF